MVRGNHHTVAKTALAKSGFKIRNALVPVRGKIGGGPDRRCSFASMRLVFADAHVGDLPASVRSLWDHAAGGVEDEFRLFKNGHENS
jgi:hypothetical protein